MLVPIRDKGHDPMLADKRDAFLIVNEAQFMADAK